MDEKQTRKEIDSLKKSLSELKSFLIGIDGKDGLRNQINALHLELESVKNSYKEIMDFLTEFRIQQSNMPYMYATKTEVTRMKEEILEQLKAMEKERREEKKQERRDTTSVQYTRFSLYIASAALVVSIIFNIVSTFF